MAPPPHPPPPQDENTRGKNENSKLYSEQRELTSFSLLDLSGQVFGKIFEKISKHEAFSKQQLHNHHIPSFTGFQRRAGVPFRP